MNGDTHGDSRGTADQSTPSERRDVEEHGAPHQEAEDTTAGDRETSPMQPFSARQVGVGIAVLAVGLAVTFGIPLLLV